MQEDLWMWTARNSTYEYTNHYFPYPLSLTSHINHNGCLIAYKPIRVVCVLAVNIIGTAVYY